MLLANMNYLQVRDLDKSDLICVLPVGSVEAHGPQLPVGTDNLIPERILTAIAAAHPNELVVAPAIPYGHNWELQSCPGTVNVATDLLTRYVTAVGQGLIASGFRVLVLWNGHGGNVPALTTACEELADAGAAVAVLTWWLDFATDIRRHVASQGHAGADEVSVLLHTDPRLVGPTPADSNYRKFNGVVRAPGIGAQLYPQVFSGNPADASAAVGQRIVATVADRAWQRFVAVRSGDWLAPL